MPHKVLIVEDESAISRLIQFLLKREGLEAFIAADGLEALDAVKQHQPDLILLDVTMPRLDGLSVRQRVRDDPQTAHTPVVLLTGKSDLPPVEPGMEHLDAYLPKPFDPVDLISTVQRMLPQS